MHSGLSKKLNNLTKYGGKTVVIERYPLLPTDHNSPILPQCAISDQTIGDTCINLLVVPSVTVNVPVNELVGARLCHLDNQCQRSGVLHLERTCMT